MTDPFVGAPESAAVSPGTLPHQAHPPIRWGGVVWGLILIAISGVTLFVVSSSERILAVAAWLSHLDAGAAWALGLALAGGIIVVLALLGAIRGAQRRQEHAGRA